MEKVNGPNKEKAVGGPSSTSGDHDPIVCDDGPADDEAEAPAYDEDGPADGGNEPERYDDEPANGDDEGPAEELALGKLVELRLIQQNRNGGCHFCFQFGSDPLGSRGVPFGQVFPDVPSKDAYVFIDRVQRLTPPLVFPSVLWCAQEGRSYFLIIETIEAWEEILVVGVRNDVISRLCGATFRASNPQ